MPGSAGYARPVQAGVAVVLEVIDLVLHLLELALFGVLILALRDEKKGPVR